MVGRPISLTEGIDTGDTGDDTLQHVLPDLHNGRRRRIIVAVHCSASVFLLVVVYSYTGPFCTGKHMLA